MVTRRSQSWSRMINSNIPFVQSQSSLSFLKEGYFKLWPWNNNVKVVGVVKVQDHTVSRVSKWYTFFFVSHQSIPDSYFEFWPWKIRGQGWGQSQCHIVHKHPADAPPFWFHFNRINHSGDVKESVWLWKSASEIFKVNLAKISNSIPLKSDQIISMTRRIYIPSFVVIGRAVLTLPCRQIFSYQCHSHGLGSRSQKVHQYIFQDLYFVPNM